MTREVVNYRQQLAKLSPGFDDCPAPCQRTIESETPDYLTDFCETCDVRFQWGFFKQSFEYEINRAFPDGCAWDFDLLFADVSYVMSENQQKPRGYPRNCDVKLARCLDIVRVEEFRPRRIHYWELQQKKPNG
jgi:hypothetical protein